MSKSIFKKFVSVAMVTIVLGFAVGAWAQRSGSRQQIHPQILETIRNLERELVSERCDVERSEKCAQTLYVLGATLSNYNVDSVKARINLQRLIDEYPTSMHVLGATMTLRSPEIMRGEVDGTQLTFDVYEKQLTFCENQRSDDCPRIMFQFASTYYGRAVMGGDNSCSDYSMMIQTLQRLLNEYPDATNAQHARQMLAQAEALRNQRC